MGKRKPILRNLTDFERGFRKIGIIDIESTGLRADFGYMLCVCIKTVRENSLNGPTWTVRIDDPRNKKKNDKWLTKELIKEMNTYDLLLGWNSSQFDYKFINSRCMVHHIAPAIKQHRRDLLYIARANFRFRNNRLVTWSELVSGENQKTKLTPKLHMGTLLFERWAINSVVHHCKIDVMETEKVYKALIPYMGKCGPRRGG